MREVVLAMLAGSNLPTAPGVQDQVHLCIPSLRARDPSAHSCASGSGSSKVRMG